MAPSYNPFQPGFTDDPYPHYREMREGDPVHHSPMDIWVLFRYEDVFRLLRDPALSVDERNAKPTPMMELARQVMGDAIDRGSNAMLNRDPPDHTRLRRLVSKAFTPKMIEQLRPRIEQLVSDALDEAGAEWDVIDGLAFPLPFQVISELLGTPETDTAQLREWSGTLVRSLEPVPDPELLKAIAEAGVNIQQLIMEIIDWKRKNPAEDLLSALIAAEDAGDTLTQDELAEQVALLYLAGHETTVNLIGNGTLALLSNPEQMQRLYDDPSLDSNAIEELLRYDSPVQMTRRIPLSPMTVGENELEAGSVVILGLGASNRDPDHWGPTAEELNVGREGASQHVSFGGGHHYCLGSHLARLEGEVAVGTMVRRFPKMRISADPVWNGRINLRGLSHLPVSTA